MTDDVRLLTSLTEILHIKGHATEMGWKGDTVGRERRKLGDPVGHVDYIPT